MTRRKVGTLSLGGMLIFYGVLFLIHLFTDAVSYELIFQLWPVMFLMLGVEVLLSALPKSGAHFKLDVASVVLICLLILFAVSMAGLDVAMHWSREIYQTGW